MKSFLNQFGDNVSILGTQWGDEGKGKLVDAIADQFDYICRSTGGANAGHTIYANGQKYIFRLLPSGLLHTKTTGIIGNGCVLSIADLLEELDSLKKLGLDVSDRLKISLQAHLLFDYHKKIDFELEERKGENKIGTTCKGIGPAYTDKISRIGIRCEDLFDLDLLKEKIEKNCKFHAQNYGIELDADAEFLKISAQKDLIKPLLADTRIILKNAIKKRKKILFEGAQAHHLDIDHGTYPFVTSSNVSAGGISTGLGIPPKAIHSIIGIAKAYTTRVGSGPFVTELDNELGKEIRKNGGEFGAVTGRPRRCGWFDAVVVKNSVDVNGVDSLNLTKLDVLTGMKELKIATNYFLGKTELFSPPNTRKANQNLEVKYLTLEGWSEDISEVRNYDDLPKNAKKYIETIEKYTECPVSSIGVGMDREALIYRNLK
jgi:adenylosuccinate synthase